MSEQQDPAKVVSELRNKKRQRDALEDAMRQKPRRADRERKEAELLAELAEQLHGRTAQDEPKRRDPAPLAEQDPGTRPEPQAQPQPERKPARPAAKRRRPAPREGLSACLRLELEDEARAERESVAEQRQPAESQKPDGERRALTIVGSEPQLREWRPAQTGQPLAPPVARRRPVAQEPEPLEAQRRQPAESQESEAQRRIAELRAEMTARLQNLSAQPGERRPARAERRRPTQQAEPQEADPAEREPEARRGRRGRRDPEAQAPQGDPAARARDICLQQLAARPRTRDELKKALLRKEIDAETAEQVLGRLDAVGLIDDKAFAEMWVQSRHTYQGVGPRALAVELRRRGVDKEVAAEAVAMVDSDAEEDRARQLVRKRLPSMSSADQQAKIRRLVGMLARKGYSQGLSYRVVKEELANQGEETDLLDTTD